VRREPALLTEGKFDVLVIGGGITGAGVALDAAARGMKVALVDKGDFACATSSASSKLVHGGLRYLEHAQFHLVYEALSERRRLLRNAPHLVKPLRFILPFYRRSRLPRWKARIGLYFYDLLAGSHNLRRSRDMSVLRLRRSFPALRPQGLIGAAEYYDAQMEDSRLCLEVIRSAVSLGACCVNYVEASRIDFSSNDEAEILLTDRIGNDKYIVRARQVLNATGPWVDAVRRMAGNLDSAPALQPTKGVHVIVAGTSFADGGEPLSRRTGFTLLHPEDGRVFFVLPWQGHTLLGTTDTFCDEPGDALSVSQAEKQYLLNGYNQHFSPPLGLADIRGQFAGLRPLLRSRPNDPSSRSREFRIIEGPGGLLSVAGGKWTTYRHMAELIIDRVAEKLHIRRRCRTANLLLDGAPSLPWGLFALREAAAIASKFDWPDEVARHLVDRYGRRAHDVAAMIHARSECQPVVEGEPDLIGEWAYQRSEEMALTRSDLLLRRSRIGLWHEELLRETDSRLEIT
jgi:glycerol-3-phosphate dehydrogenase